MRLVDLEPEFLRYELRVVTYDVVDGDPATWRERGCPTRPETGPKEYRPRVATVAEAHGIQFLCPGCFAKNGGVVGTHAIDVTFADRGVPPELGSHNTKGEPSRWNVTGTTFENLSLTPSVDCGCWHGHITNGEVR